MGNVSLYSVGKEMRKTLFKIIQVEGFAGHSWLGQVAKWLAKYSLAKDYLASNMCFPHYFSRVVHSRINREQVARSIVLSNLHQVNGQNGQMPFSCQKNQRFAPFPKLINEMLLFWNSICRKSSMERSNLKKKKKKPFMELEFMELEFHLKRHCRAPWTQL